VGSALRPAATGSATRLLLVPTVADVRAPTVAELNAGQDLTPYLLQQSEERRP
jgi:hypothetical protein